MGFNNWFAIFPHEDKNKIKEEYEKLNLRDFAVGILIINDNLSNEEEDEYVDFVNENMKYSGQIDVSKETELMKAIEEMGGLDNDDLYLIRDGKVSHKKTNLQFVS